MVDPNASSTAGIDSEKYTGFAFGIGVERVAKACYTFLDLHAHLWHQRVLRQF